MNSPIPLINLAAQHASLRPELDAAYDRVMSSGRYILGSEVEAFERAFAAYLGIEHAVGVSSGTAALQLALMAAGIGRGHEVITVSYTAVATVVAIEQTGATPVLVDIEPDRYTLDPSALAAVLTSRTRAIVPVHLYGCPADMEPILAFSRAHQLRVIEDCAQAHGARYRGQPVGTLSDAGAFSFYPTKNLGALGDGGAVVTADADLAARLRELRQYGWRRRYVSDTPGINARLDELQAAFLAVKLTHLDAWNERRRQLAGLYRIGLTDAAFGLPADPAGCLHVYHQFVIRTRERDALRAALEAQGINAGVLYPLAVHQQPAYEALLRAGATLPASQRLAAENLALPIFPELDEPYVDRVCRALNAWAKHQSA